MPSPRASIGGVNLSVAVLIVHGWMYVVYLMSNFRLWSLMRWPFSKMIILALGGVVPFLSFVVEKRFHAEVEAELAAEPAGAAALLSAPDVGRACEFAYPAAVPGPGPASQCAGGRRRKVG